MSVLKSTLNIKKLSLLSFPILAECWARKCPIILLLTEVIRKVINVTLNIDVSLLTEADFEDVGIA